MEIRVFVFFLFLFCCLAVLGQKKNAVISDSYEDQSIIEIFDELSTKTGYSFSYNPDILPKGEIFTIEGRGEPVDEFLSRLLIGTNLSYSFYKNQIIIKYVAPEKKPQGEPDFIIIGEVVDQQGAPFAGVNVFLDGTIHGAVTNSDGTYLIKNVPAGYYAIVFSHVGYETKEFPVDEFNGGERIMDCKMKVAPVELMEVTVVSSEISRGDEQWDELFESFTKDLFGVTDNAKDCYIQNPEAIVFHYSRDTLKVTATKPLTIINNALGLRINYLLESYKKFGNELKFRGNLKYDLMDSTSKQRRQWRKKRNKAYYGSFNHFKKSLLQGRLKKDGYTIFQTDFIDNFNFNLANPLSENDILRFQGDHYELDFQGYIIVQYRKEEESEAYKTKEGDFLLNYSKGQLSGIKLLKGPVRIDFTGQVKELFAIATYGYWSWERMADLVPINFEP